MPTGRGVRPLTTRPGFIIEGFVDEIAGASKRSPMDVRSEILGQTSLAPRMQNVHSIAMEKANWGAPLPKGRGRGAASHFTFGSYAA